LRILCVLALLANLFFWGCGDQSTLSNTPIFNKLQRDTILITEIITEAKIASVNPSENIVLPTLEEPIVAQISTREPDKTYLIILTPGEKIEVEYTKDSLISTNSQSDSLLNYLWKSNLQFIQQNSSFIFQTDKLDSITLIFKEFLDKRSDQINEFKDSFKTQEIEILHYQNKARIYSFLFWLGRVSRTIDADQSYFDFISEIEKPSIYLKSLPDIYLYKYEIEYLRQHKTLDSIPQFINYLEERVEDLDLTDFLKSIYLKALIHSPSYWTKHEQLFTSDVLKSVLEQEKNNKYSYLLDLPVASFFKSQNGEQAYNFTAEDISGNVFLLEDFKGKVVYIDVWATWCGPCISHRPNVIELAKHYQDNDKVEILMISVDSDQEKWSNFLKEEGQVDGLNLFIENGMRSKFGDSYNIKSIPRYILIGRDGKIIHSNMAEPSIKSNAEIDKALLN
jgi:thiol-disulfide isomerase/thioredoxin